jgi:hypothetical protein
MWKTVSPEVRRRPISPNSFHRATETTERHFSPNDIIRRTTEIASEVSLYFLGKSI